MVKRKHLRGFTLIELLVVIAVIGMLLSLVAPRYWSSVDSARDAVLRENLHTMRDAIDKHYADAGRYPESLNELVTKRYLRSIPRDPVTERSDTWTLVEADGAVNGGVIDVRSGAPGQGRDGTPYSGW